MNSNGPDSYRKQRAAYIELASNGIGESGGAKFGHGSGGIMLLRAE